MLTKFINYCKDSYNELVHKTTWPTWKQLMGQAILVLGASLVIAVVVFAMDWCFGNVMELIYPVALNEGLTFAIREGGRTVGAGQITKVIE